MEELNCSVEAGNAIALSAKSVFVIGALILMDILIISGNALVIVAVFTSEGLRNSITSMFITSLAVADLLLGIFILPFSIANEILVYYWVFGEVWCQIWLVVDVWMCTASIYSLVVISVERYVAILKPLRYQSIVTTFRGKTAVIGAWTVSFLICCPPIAFQWPKAFHPLSPARCICSPLNNSPVYIAYSATGSFFLPMAIIVYIYFRIYQVVRRLTYADMELHRDWPAESSPILDPPDSKGMSPCQDEKGLPSFPTSTTLAGEHNHQNVIPQDLSHELASPPSHHCSPILAFRNHADQLKTSFVKNGAMPANPQHGKLLSRILLKKAKNTRLATEVKAMKMVAAVTGCFICSWLGFSVVYLLRAFTFCQSNPECIPSPVFSVVFWAGYANSAFNPFLYALFNSQFRQAFKKLLTCSRKNS